VRIHFEDSYAGIPMTKCPEDLLVCEHLLWESAPSIVIELSTDEGGSALCFRDRLLTLQQYGRVSEPHVITIDIETGGAKRRLAAVDPDYARTITLIEADVTDNALPGRVAELVPPDAGCMVVEDSAHVYDTTQAALYGFARFVPPGGFLVVEDGCVDIEKLRYMQSWPRGVLPALDRWLSTSEASSFIRRRDLERYVVTCHPQGFLQRTV
jgi:cephalosporin hydroxylase